MRKIVLVLLTFSFLFMNIFLSISLVSAHTPDNEIYQEEKVYSDATIEDEFSEDVVLVVLTNIESQKLKTYTKEDFNGDGADDVLVKWKDQISNTVNI